MRTHEIDLHSFLEKGHVTVSHENGELHMTITRAIPTRRFDVEHLRINSYIHLPNTYRLPLRIDLTVQIDAPGLYVLLGDGHVNFGTTWDDNRRIDDILDPARKVLFFDNHIPLNTWTEISLVYGLGEMQILVDGQEQYYGTKERYMKSPLLSEKNLSGFPLKIACDKRVNLRIRSVRITEYEALPETAHAEIPSCKPTGRNIAVPEGEKPTFETCVSRLPTEIWREVTEMDAWLRSLGPMKFSRQVEKNGNKITYVASKSGFSYAMYLSGDRMTHSLQWYIITNGKPETWGRKADRMEETLSALSEDSEEFAGRMFDNLDDCVGCYPSRCLAKTMYQFGGAKKLACHGKVKFKMCAGDFADARRFIAKVNDLEQ